MNVYLIKLKCADREFVEIWSGYTPYEAIEKMMKDWYDQYENDSINTVSPDELINLQIEQLCKIEDVHV